MQDKFGREVQIGDEIVYIVRRSSRVRLTKAVVAEIVDNPRRWYSNKALKVKVTDSVYKSWIGAERVLCHPTFIVVSAPQLKLTVTDVHDIDDSDARTSVEGQ